MSGPSKMLIIWNDFTAALNSSGYSLFYIEAYIVCIIIFSLLFSHQQNSSDQTEARLTWSRILFLQILLCMAGILRVFVDVNLIPKNHIMQYVTASLNFALLSCIYWLTFLYTEIYHKTKFLERLRYKIFSAIPFMISIIILTVSPFIDSESENLMLKPVLFSTLLLLNILYSLSALTLTLLHRRKMGKYERNNISITAVYPALFLIIGTVQVFNWKMPFLCYAMVISDILVYINYADSLVSVDPLTKIPNRNGLVRYLSEKLETGKFEKLYLFAVDIDELKDINDSYGRSEGDKALIIVANALKKFQNEEHECYIARYSGDEFIITADIESDEELYLFIEHIRNYVVNAATSNKVRYSLRVSIGYSRYEAYSRTETISGLIEEADKVLGENREQRQFQAMWQRRKMIF